MANILNNFQTESHKTRAAFMLTGSGILLVLLLARFFLLQVENSEYYIKKSNQNRIKAIPIEATRGLILDRNRRALVENRASYSLSVIPLVLKATDEKKLVHRISQLVGMNEKDILTKITKRKTFSFEPVKIKRNISFEILSYLEEHKEKFPGVIYQVEPRRVYVYKNVAAHLLGYIGDMTEKEVRKLRKKGYLYGEMIGRSGIERVYESNLRGSPGVRYMEVNARGREIGELKEKYHAPRGGNNIILTIDLELQQYIEAVLSDSLKGSIVVLDTRNGDILSMVSRPSFDPNNFSTTLSPTIWRELYSNKANPLLNRSIKGLYPPGSIVKMLTGITGLETGACTQHSLFKTCRGGYNFNNYYFGCWKHKGHGKLDLHEALVQSCDVFFYQLAPKLPLEKWAGIARDFNIGKTTGIDLYGESSGLFPTAEFYEKKFGAQVWPKGNLLNISIGQGDLLVTPLQMAVFTALLANEGEFVKPHLMKEIILASGKVVKMHTNHKIKISNVSNTSFGIVKSAMLDVIENERGTGRGCKIPGISIAGKTGSAENPHGATHAWFIAFAPFENPRIAISVVIETGGHGGSVAAPLARKILLKYFGKITSPPTNGQKST